MNKLQMAHEWAIETMRKDGFQKYYMQETVRLGWEYADAMQAEADKREKEEAEKKRADIREMLKDNNTFVEREGQHFDDVEWQPDWSQAPRGDVIGWKMKTKEQAIWIAQDGGYYLAPSFNYQGNWQNSLRKRPQ